MARRFSSVLFCALVALVIMSGCMPGGADPADTGTDASVPPVRDPCMTNGEIRSCVPACYNVGIQHCDNAPDGTLRWTLCTPVMGLSVNTCDAGTGSDSGSDAATDAGSDSGSDAGMSCVGTEPPRVCAGSTTCMPIVQICDTVTHTWSTCQALPNMCSDAGTDAGSDAIVDTGTDTGTDSGSDAGACPDPMSRLGTPCGAGVGACFRTGTWTCSGSSVVCNAVPGTPASAEICGNGIDDNCNGLIDEGCTPCGGDPRVGTACTSGVGACQRSGSWICNAGGMVVCNAVPGAPSPEVCNGIDDNCNGLIDDGIPSTTCSAGVGACQRSGPSVCTGGVFVCMAVAGTPTAEICNSIDDDCNGLVDDGIPSTPCTRGVGACQRSGSNVCTSGTLVCNAVPGTPTMEICNGIDDDCNGLVDDGISCVDAGPDTGVDAGSDVIVDTGTDTGPVDTGVDVATDVSSDGSASICPCTSGSCTLLRLCVTPCGYTGVQTVGEYCAGLACHPLSPESCSTTDAGTDSGTVVDTGTDAGPVDTGADVAMDGAMDVATDVVPDAGVDVVVDSGSDVAVDTATDAAVDAGADAIADATDVVDASAVDATDVVDASTAPILVPSCDGRTLTGFPAACNVANTICFHVCNLSPTTTTSTSPNAGNQTTSMHFIQNEDPLVATDLGTVTAPAGAGAWEADVFVPIHTTLYAPIFNAQNNLAPPVIGPNPFIWAVGQNWQGQGIARNGLLRIYVVGPTGVQTPVNWEITANDPTNSGTATAFQAGGNAHPLSYFCPLWYAVRTCDGGSCSYVCNNSTADEPVFSGTAILY